MSFFVRWALNSLGLWVAIRLFGNGIDSGAFIPGYETYILAGLIFSVVNSLLRPILIIISLPAIVLSFGLFTLVVNGVLVYTTIALVPNFNITFGYAILAGIILSLVNYIVSGTLYLIRESNKKR